MKIYRKCGLNRCKIKPWNCSARGGEREEEERKKERRRRKKEEEREEKEEREEPARRQPPTTHLSVCEKIHSIQQHNKSD